MVQTMETKNLDKFKIFKQPTKRVPGFQLFCREWMTLNLRTAQVRRGKCSICRDLETNFNVTVNITQTPKHIVEKCLGRFCTNWYETPPPQLDVKI